MSIQTSTITIIPLIPIISIIPAKIQESIQINEPQTEFEVLKTSKSKPLLKIKNYYFLKNKERNGCIYWVCKESRRNSKCQSRCITDDQLNRLIKQPGEHNHDPTLYPKPKLSRPKPKEHDKPKTNSETTLTRKPKFKLMSTNKSEPLLNINNYIFYKEKQSKGIIYWSCKEKRRNKCKSRCTSSEDTTTIIKQPTEHNHEPCTKLEIQKIQNNTTLKKLAKDASKKIKLKYLKTTKLATQINLNNYIYQRNKVKNGVTYWSCKLFKRCKCPSRLRTKPDESNENELIIINDPKDHNHVAYTDEQIEKMKVMAKKLLRKKELESSRIEEEEEEDQEPEKVEELPVIRQVVKLIDIPLIDDDDFNFDLIENHL